MRKHSTLRPTVSWYHLWKITESAVGDPFHADLQVTNANNEGIEHRLADFRKMYDEKYGPDSSQVMLFEVDDGVMGYCKGDKTGLAPPMAGPEADAWFAELAGTDKAAPATTEEKKKSRQELRKTKRDVEKEAKRRRNGA